MAHPAVSVHIENVLFRRIVDGHFPPGSMLPSVNELAASFRVSSRTLQKAIHRQACSCSNSIVRN